MGHWRDLGIWQTSLNDIVNGNYKQPLVGDIARAKKEKSGWLLVVVGSCSWEILKTDIPFFPKNCRVADISQICRDISQRHLGEAFELPSSQSVVSRRPFSMSLVCFYVHKHVVLRLKSSYSDQPSFAADGDHTIKLRYIIWPWRQHHSTSEAWAEQRQNHTSKNILIPRPRGCALLQWSHHWKKRCRCRMSISSFFRRQLFLCYWLSVGCDCEYVIVWGSWRSILSLALYAGCEGGGDYVTGTTYIRSRHMTGHFFPLTRHSSKGPVFFVGIWYLKLKNFVSVLNECQNIGHVAFCFDFCN